MNKEDIKYALAIVTLQLKELQKQLWDYPLTWEQKNRLEAAITNLIEIDQALPDEEEKEQEPDIEAMINSLLD